MFIIILTIIGVLLVFAIVAVIILTAAINILYKKELEEMDNDEYYC